MRIRSYNRLESGRISELVDSSCIASPSLLPSPSGRGRNVASTSAKLAPQESGRDGVRGSLCLRERAGVRGKNVQSNPQLPNLPVLLEPRTAAAQAPFFHFPL